MLAVAAYLLSKAVI